MTFSSRRYDHVETFVDVGDLAPAVRTLCYEKAYEQEGMDNR
jgi:hypothetical protein